MILWLYTRNTDIFPPDWGMLRRFSLDTFGSFFKHIFNRWTAFAAYFLTPGQPFTAFPRPLSARLASLSSAASVGNRIVPGRWLRRRMPSATPTELRQKIQYRRKHEERGETQRPPSHKHTSRQVQHTSSAGGASGGTLTHLTRERSLGPPKMLYSIVAGE